MRTLNHIGYLTDNIANTASAFEMMGYTAGETVRDDTQRTFICFLSKCGEVSIELVQPYDDNRTMQKLLAKRGVSPYHVCYDVEDIHGEVARMVEQDWTPLFRPVAAPAMGGRLICYLWNGAAGFIELVAKSE